MDLTRISSVPADPLEIAGLPLHPLIIHFVVVLTPLTVLALLLAAFWPAARRRLGIVTPLAALVVLVLVPITTAAGESLKTLVGATPAVLAHEALGLMLLPWAIALFVVSAVQWAWYRFAQKPVAERSRVWARVIVVGIDVAAVAVAIGTVTLLVLIGDSGARAVWGGIIGG
jgi:hypothetical protein